VTASDEISGVVIELPRESARNYRETGQPRDLRVVCAWRSRDALIVLAEHVGLGVVTILLALCACAGSGHFDVGIAAIVFGAMSLLALYRLVARTVNRTTLALGARGLSSIHGPLPWRGGVQIPTADVLAFGVEKRDAAIGGEYFDLWARTKDREITLVHGLEDLKAAMRMLAVLEDQRRLLQPVDAPSERASNAPDVRASAARRFARVSRPDGDVR
jgi:hypothetical protein